MKEFEAAVEWFDFDRDTVCNALNVVLPILKRARANFPQWRFIIRLGLNVAIEWGEHFVQTNCEND